MSQTPVARRVQRAIKHPNKLVTFVYGTLRPGEGNYWIEPDVIEAIEPCTTPGVMYVGGIPFCDFKDHSGVITGTLLIMDASDVMNPRSRVSRMIRMEQGAGYEPLVVEVKLPDDPGSNVPALAWHYGRDLNWDNPFKPGDWTLHPFSARYEINEHELYTSVYRT